MNRIIGSCMAVVVLGCAVTAGAGETGVELGPIVVTAGRAARELGRVASGVTVIDRQDIEESGAATVAEVISGQPGVQVYDNSTVKTATVDIRGFGDTANRNVLVLVNGRKVNSIDISGPDLLQIPLATVERIEMIRGAGSVLYGDNAVGGVVNIITRTPNPGLDGRAGYRFGSYDTQDVDLDLSGGRNGWYGYAYSRYYRTDGYRVNSDLVAKDYQLRAGQNQWSHMNLDVIAGWHQDDYGLPGGLNDTELKNLGRKGSASPDDFATGKDRHVQISTEIFPNGKEEVGPGHVVLDVSYRNSDTFAYFADFAFGTKRAIDRYGASGKYVLQRDIFGREGQIVAGVDSYTTDNDILGTDSNTDDLTISKDEIGGYLTAEFETADNVFVSGGSRWQKAWYTFDQRNGTPSYETRSPAENVNSGGIRYEYGSASNVFFEVQQTFRFLATDEWYDTFSGLNTDLTQQTGIQYEAGVRHQFHEAFRAGLTPYYIENKNEIFFDPTGGSFGFGANSNYDKTRRIGVEVEQVFDAKRFWNVTLLDQWEWYAQYTFQDPEFVNGPNDGKQIPFAAEHLAQWGWRLGLVEHLQLHLSGRYVGSRYAINDTGNATGRVKPHTLADAKLSWTAEHWKAFIAVNNIFDEKYFAYVSKSSGSDVKDYFPAPERNVLAGMELRF